MTALTDRLRGGVYGIDRTPLCDEAANEIDRLRVQGLMWRDERDALREQLANMRAADIHSCHDGCTRSGCVNARLRNALELIAAPRRPDGTWNRERLACQQIAAAALEATK